MSDYPVHEVAGFKFSWAHEIVPNVSEPGLIDGVLDDQGLSIVYGRSGCGKTAVVVDMACRVATGKPWRGRKSKQGIVIYFAAENPTSTGRRIFAWKQKHGVEGDIPLVMVQTSLTVDMATTQRALELVEWLEGETGKKVRLIVFDTLARTIHGDENTAVDMGSYIKNVDKLKDKGLHVLVIHHTGKDESRGARGSSSLRAGADHEFELAKDKGERIGTMTLTKVREGDLEGAEFHYELRQFGLGKNANGAEVSTIVVEESLLAPPKGMVREDDDERIREFIEGWDGILTEDTMRETLKLRKKPDTNRKAWQRARERGVYNVQNGIVQL